MKVHACLRLRAGYIAAALAIASIALATCDNTSFFSVLGNKAQIPTLTISPVSTTVSSNGIVQFSASGGVPPYTFSIVPGGVGTIDQSSGLYMAPATPGTTFILVTDKQPATAKATVTNVDYWVTAINNTSASLIVDTAISGNFTVKNAGTANGAQNITWTVYLSTSASLGTGSTVISTGSTTGGLNSGASTLFSFSGTWPSTPGTYYLIASVSAPDALVDPNSTRYTGPITTRYAQVKYVISAVTVTAGSPSPPGGSMSGSFTLTNSGTDGGTQPVTWEAYASTSTTITAQSVLLSSGTVGPYAAGYSAPISFTANWPLAYGNYYLVVRARVSVDANPLNNVPVAQTAPATAVGVYTTTEPNDSLAQANDLGVTLQPGMSICVTGNLIAGGSQVDYLSFNAGTANTVTFNLSWPSTGTPQYVYMYVYDTSGTQLQWSSVNDLTHSIMLWTVGANASTKVYISPQLVGPISAAPYTLIITAN